MMDHGVLLLGELVLEDQVEEVEGGEAHWVGVTGEGAVLKEVGAGS